MEGGVWCRLFLLTVPASNSLSLPFYITSVSTAPSLLALLLLPSLRSSYIEESWESVRPMDNPPGYDEAHGISTKEKAGNKRWYGPLVCVPVCMAVGYPSFPLHFVPGPTNDRLPYLRPTIPLPPFSPYPP